MKVKVTLSKGVVVQDKEYEGRKYSVISGTAIEAGEFFSVSLNDNAQARALVPAGGPAEVDVSNLKRLAPGAYRLSGMVGV